MKSSTTFLDCIFDNLAKDGIDVSVYQLDHMCWSASTEQGRQNKCLEYEQKRAQHVGMPVDIRGRLIATMRLREPIRYRDRSIELVEITAPKKHGNVYAEGWEHVEFVIDASFEDFMARYPHISFDKRGIAKEINPDIVTRYPDGTRVKFHHKPLDRVILEEQS